MHMTAELWQKVCYNNKYILNIADNGNNVDEQGLKKNGVENRMLKKLEIDNFKSLVDFHMDLELSGWEKIRVRGFPGYSHETITEEIYVKGNKGYV